MCFDMTCNLIKKESHLFMVQQIIGTVAVAPRQMTSQN